MKKMSTILIALLACSAAVAGENARSELSAVAAEIRQVTSAARSSAATLALKQAVHQAREDYEQAVAGTAGVRELDERIEALNAELRRLASQRKAKLRANKGVLDAKLRSLEQAEATYNEACRGGVRGEELLRRRNALMRDMTPEEISAALDASKRTGAQQ